MKRLFIIATLLLAVASVSAQKSSTKPLRKAFADKFLIGVALNVHQVRSEDKSLHDLIRREFSSVVAENCMKSASLQPREGGILDIVGNNKNGIICKREESQSLAAPKQATEASVSPVLNPQCNICRSNTVQSLLECNTNVNRMSHFVFALCYHPLMANSLFIKATHRFTKKGKHHISFCPPLNNWLPTFSLMVWSLFETTF